MDSWVLYPSESADVFRVLALTSRMVHTYYEDSEGVHAQGACFGSWGFRLPPCGNQKGPTKKSTPMHAKKAQTNGAKLWLPMILAPA